MTLQGWTRPSGSPRGEPEPEPEDLLLGKLQAPTSKRGGATKAVVSKKQDVGMSSEDCTCCSRKGGSDQSSPQALNLPDVKLFESASSLAQKHFLVGDRVGDQGLAMLWPSLLPQLRGAIVGRAHARDPWCVLQRRFGGSVEAHVTGWVLMLPGSVRTPPMAQDPVDPRRLQSNHSDSPSYTVRNPLRGWRDPRQSSENQIDIPNRRHRRAA
eukprot:CAMPEP_0173442896 /NCGR_PEP_ID=MMETSP1357-20121228/28483_1 /TAXON_ID=77926 /ORGANISM="Hemiselmis rufescens, Strain PCC563" /LENGTH=211 /DNA_ID=CAMNT_0014408729 /DNA_START=3 /DNA_END=636 /DNA_ORIENTATION=+